MLRSALSASSRMRAALAFPVLAAAMSAAGCMFAIAGNSLTCTVENAADDTGVSRCGGHVGHPLIV